MSVKLQRTDLSRSDIPIFEGLLNLGRGELLQCADKKVSRNHAELNLSNNGDIYLTPRHTNPCYLNEDSEVMKKDVPVLLKNGDIFSLLPDKFIYKIVIEKDSLKHNYADVESNSHDNKLSDETNCGVANTTSKGVSLKNRKRVLPSWFDQNAGSSKAVRRKPTPQKKAVKGNKMNVSKNNSHTDGTKVQKSENKIKNEVKNELEEDDASDELCENNSDLKPSPNKVVRKTTTPPKKAVKGNKEDNSNKSHNNATEIKKSEDKIKKEVKNESEDDASEELHENNSKFHSESAHSDLENDEEAGNSAISINRTKIKRPSCPYRSGCYRRNTKHLEQFAHPDESDYLSESDDAATGSEDERPECEYGLKCYRKNEEHKKRYKHTRKVQPKRRAALKKKVYQLQDSDDSEFSLDDLTDESDAYTPSSDD